MRTLAPIRVRSEGGNYLYTCRLCGRGHHWGPFEFALNVGLAHLKIWHPGPWSEAQLDTDGSGK